MSRETFIEDATHELQSLLSRKGAILYSSWETLKPGRLYILGLNPGEGPERTIKTVLDTLPEYKENAYLDEDWSTDRKRYGIGGHPLQVRLRSLAESVGMNLRDTCASNLVFVSSRDRWGICYPEHADICWGVHKSILEIVQPSVLLVFGNGSVSPYEYLRARFAPRPPARENEEQAVPAGHGWWTCKSCKLEIEGKLRTVVGFPHLSWFSPATKPGILRWFKKEWDSACS